jgi:large subunit ribosomal protein L15
MPTRLDKEFSIMMSHEITAQVGAHKHRKRLGRGESSGHGKTSTRGTKGSGARAGGEIPWGSEGGNMPLFRRLPKRGFNNNAFRQNFWTINVADLEKFFDAGATIDIAALIAKGLIRDERYPLKVLGDGEVTKKFSITAGKFSKQAEEKIKKAGGSITTLELDRNKGKVNPKTGKFISQKPEAKNPKPGKKPAKKA